MMNTSKHKKLQFLLIAFLLASLLFISSCDKKKIINKRSFVILSINDVYRTNGLNNGQIGGLSRVKTLRDKITKEGSEVLLLHAGDFLSPSFSARVNQGAAMIDIMNQLNTSNSEFDENMIVVFGNHEFDKSKLKYMPRLQQRIDESQFYWMDSNINWLRDDTLGEIHSEKLKTWMIKEISGIKVGIYSLTTNMTQPQYIASFDDPIEVTKHYVPFLKSKGAEVVIALTHQQLSDDKLLLNLESKFRPNLIIGGHEHYRQMEQNKSSWIIKADADALSAAIIEVSITANKQASFLPTFVELNETIKKDPKVQQNIDNWAQKTGVNYCQKINQPSDCLNEAYGSTKVNLIAEESEIRRFETNMGNFIADTARNEFRYCQADIALINSGSVRLNHNISANSSITRKHIEGMFPYPSNLKLIQINGKILKQMLTHTIDKWTANGHWLLVSGIKFIHNPATQQFSQLRWAKDNTLILDEQTLLVVVPNYLISAKTDHDGYSMINEKMLQECGKNGSSLKQLVINQIKYSAMGIQPQVDGRICNTLRGQCNK